MILHTVNITKLCFWKDIKMSKKSIQHKTVALFISLVTAIRQGWYIVVH